MLGSSPEGAPLESYVVLEYLSEGGMGAIFIGKRLGQGGFEREVVLKQLLPEFTSQPEFIDLFKREAMLSGSLDHANIVKTIDFVTAGQDYFLVMEYVPGADLRTLLKRAKRRRERLSPAAAIYVTNELLHALSYAHNRNANGTALNLIHRDISPSNILVSRNGEVKLTDFGIAKASTHNSGLYRVKGKVGYMSPEQARSEDLDQRSDLYSLAVCLYEIITGERLFVAAGLTTSAEEIYSQPVPRVSRKVEGLHPDFDQVMFTALAENPDQRYQTAGEFREALHRCAHRHGLLISAPDLAQHLREICGPADTWRDPDADIPARQSTATAAFGHEGTQVLDDFGAEGTQELGPEAADEDEVMSLAEGRGRVDIINESEARERRALTSMTSLSRLRGIELTSMFNLNDLPTSALQSVGDFGPDASLDDVFDSLADPHADGQQPLTSLGNSIVPRRETAPGLHGQHGSEPGPHMVQGPHPGPAPGPMPTVRINAPNGPTPPGLANPPRLQAPQGPSSPPSPMAAGHAPGPGPVSPAGPPNPMSTGRVPAPGPPVNPASTGRVPVGAPGGTPMVQVSENRAGGRIDTIDGEGGTPGVAAPKRRSWAWVVLIVILLLSIAAAAAIGMSGPMLGADPGSEPSSRLDGPSLAPNPDHAFSRSLGVGPG